jgi:hypothetical protein
MNRIIYYLFDKIEIFKIFEKKRILIHTLDNNSIINQISNFSNKILSLNIHNNFKINSIDKNLIVKNIKRHKDIYQNNCNALIIDNKYISIFCKKYKFLQFEIILFPVNIIALIPLLAIFRNFLKISIKLIGVTSLKFKGKEKLFFIVENKTSNANKRRQFAPDGLTPLEICQMISKYNAVVLRNITEIKNQTHRGDIDILISSADVDSLISELKCHIGTYPIDLYTDDGNMGFNFNGSAYYKKNFAQDIIKSAIINELNFKEPTAYMQYISYCYHLIFHGKIKNINKNEIVNIFDFKNTCNFYKFAELAKKINRNSVFNMKEIEEVLKLEKYFPDRDLLGFYSNKDPFLNRRYLTNDKNSPGLITFFVRDFGIKNISYIEIEKLISKKFLILDQGYVTKSNREKIMAGVRGGNWFDQKRNGVEAPPVYWYIAWDEHPRVPSLRRRRKHPRVDNENISLKEQIRKKICHPSRVALPIIHSSDNTFEALDHLRLIGFEPNAQLISFLRSKGLLD